MFWKTIICLHQSIDRKELQRLIESAFVAWRFIMWLRHRFIVVCVLFEKTFYVCSFEFLLIQLKWSNFRLSWVRVEDKSGSYTTIISRYKWSRVGNQVTYLTFNKRYSILYTISHLWWTGSFPNEQLIINTVVNRL